MHHFNKIACCIVLIMSSSLATAKYSDPDLVQSYGGSKNWTWHSRPTNTYSDGWITAEAGPGQRRSEDEDSKHKGWKELTPQQRKRIEKRQKQYEALPASEKEKVKKARQKYRELPPERRRELREKWEKMSPEERRKKSKGIRDKKRS